MQYCLARFKSASMQLTYSAFKNPPHTEIQYSMQLITREEKTTLKLSTVIPPSCKCFIK
jgi:hypothetical protein